MKKTRNGRRIFSREFRIEAVKRVQKGEKQSAVARDLKIAVTLIARWRRQVREGGESALCEIGHRRSKNSATETGHSDARVAELERLVGRQQAAIDFLEQALRQVEELRRTKKDDGATASSK
jgi:transposase-like protein